MYEPREIEKKWQKKWEDSSVYKTLNPKDPGFDASKKPYYILDMFPYPSGSGLHVGHASGYIGTDILARRKRMEGFNVLHPMGWDAFGLPAEQYAIQTGQHPRKTTEINANNFRRQLKLLGLSYDWSREIDTSVPEYYKWTQWLFLKLYEKGLVYLKEVPVWWCEELKTVLANEEVINGRSERGNYPCVRRPQKQWVLKITEYADRLVEDLKLLDWPESVKKMQVDWIGRSEGAEIDFQVEGRTEKIRVFSTRPDTLFGVNALVLAPEHPWVANLTKPQHQIEVEKYLAAVSVKSDLERKAETGTMTGVPTGSFAVHPLDSAKRVPIFIADYVIADYGTGAVMSVPAHDTRDHLFAKTMKLPTTVVIQPKPGITAESECFTDDGLLVNSGAYTGMESQAARAQIIQTLEKNNQGQLKVSYKLRDWVFSRQRYWGEPFPISFAADGSLVPLHESELPVLLPEMDDFTPSADGASPLGRAKDWLQHESKSKPGAKLTHSTDTMPGWAGSCWYYLRFMDPRNDKAAFSKEAVQYWKQVDMYVGGTSHAVMHLLYARFWHKVFFDLGLVPTPEPFKTLFNQGMVTAFAFKDKTGRLVINDDVESGPNNTWIRKSTGEEVERFVTKMAKSLKNVVNPDDVIEKHGCDVLRIYEMFMGPLADEKPWASDGVPGCERFLKRLWNFFHDDKDVLKPHLRLGAALPQDKAAHLKIEKALHRCIKRIDDSFENFNFNTSVAGMMEFFNTANETPESMSSDQAERLILALSPFCPHLAAELWEKSGHQGWVDHQAWPVVDPKMLIDETFELVISLNGKPRKRIQAQRNLADSAIEALARSEVADIVKAEQIMKVIVVPNKLVNIVAKL
jgi:leucyl-tRNA synthetase